MSNGPATRKLVVRGTEGGAVFDIGAQELSVYPGLDGDTEPVSTAEEDWLAPEDEAFAAAVMADEPPAVRTLEQALAVHRTMDAICRSDTIGESVTF